MTTTNTHSFYSKMPNQNDRLFHDQQIQRFDADTIKNRYGESWKTFASNVREITQQDGSIIKEYIIEDPSLLEEMKSRSHPTDSVSSTTASDDDHQQLSKNKFAQIKAKFEQKNVSNVLATPSTSSTHSNNTTTARQNSRQQIDDLYARHRRASNESIPIQTIINDKKTSIGSSNHTNESQNTYHRSQSIGSDKSKTSSFRRFDSNDEADEEVSQIHRQGEVLRRHNQDLPGMSSSLNAIAEQSRVQYEVVDEDGNPMNVNDVQDLIKMSGVRAREVPQADGTIIKEYVIDDPHVVSQFRSHQQSQPSPMSSSYFRQRSVDNDAPPPPPRIPLRQPILFRQGGSSMNDNLPHNIQQIHVLEPQRRYEYLTTTGRRIQFSITNSNNINGQFVTDSDVRELTNAINTRLLTSLTSNVPQSSAQVIYNPPKQWHPSVDLTQRQRTGSDTQLQYNNQTDLSRSASNGAIDQTSHPSQPQVSHKPVNNWNTSRYQDSHNQRRQSNELFQTSAQFLPQQQTTRSTTSPPMTNNYRPVPYQQSPAYPYQGQQQHGVRILNDYNQQQTSVKPDGHTRI